MDGAHHSRRYFWGAHAAGDLNVAFGAVVGLFLSTTTAILLNVDRASLRQGLFGLNGVLVGVAVPIFLHPHPMMWAYLLLGAAVSTVATLAVASAVKSWGIPGSTAPFVFTTWVLLLGAYSFTHLPLAAMGPPALPAAASAGGMMLSLHTVLSSLGKSISQVYLIENFWTGVLFVVAIAISSIRSAGFAVIGSVIGLGAALVLGAGAGPTASGLYGFSAVLTAMAVGSAFEKLSFRAVLYAVVATVFTVVVQAAFNTALSPLGVPPLTFPYVLTMWLFLLPGIDLTPRPKPSPVVSSH